MATAQRGVFVAGVLVLAIAGATTATIWVASQSSHGGLGAATQPLSSVATDVSRATAPPVSSTGPDATGSVGPTEGSAGMSTASPGSSATEPTAPPGTPGSSGLPAQATPNIVVLMLDDVPYLDPDTPWQATPQLKQSVIDHGVAFTDFHGETPLCCPGRVGFLTGLHTRSSHVFWNNAQIFHPEMSLATALHDSGYYTLEVGKYLNLYNRIAPEVPPGWDGFHATEGSPLYYNYRIWNDGGKPVKYGNKPADYSTDVLSQIAVDEIQKAPADQPVFAWIATTAAHDILVPAPRDADAPCTELTTWKTAATSEADLSDKPAYVQIAPIKATSHNMVPLCRVLMSVDDLFAAVRNALTATGRWDNTMFVVAGDNGMDFGAHRLGDIYDKRVPYATQLPFIVSWPDGLGDQPRSVDARLQNIDFAPTICQLVGCTLGPYPTGQSQPDGVSFLAALMGTGPAPVRDAVLSTQMEQKRSVPPWDAVTTTSDSPLASQGCSSAAQGGCIWHYIRYSDGTRELYDDSGGPCYAWQNGMPGDPCELQNLAGKRAYASLMSTLDDRLNQLVTTGR